MLVSFPEKHIKNSIKMISPKIDNQKTETGSDCILLFIAIFLTMSGVLSFIYATRPIEPSNTIPFLITALCCLITAILAVAVAIKDPSFRRLFAAGASLFAFISGLWFYVVLLSLQ